LTTTTWRAASAGGTTHREAGGTAVARGRVEVRAAVAEGRVIWGAGRVVAFDGALGVAAAVLVAGRAPVALRSAVGVAVCVAAWVAVPVVVGLGVGTTRAVVLAAFAALVEVA
jgi:hypothetical protein